MSAGPAQRAAMVNRLRSLSRGAPQPETAPDEFCEMCDREIPVEHRHLLQLDERRIVCVCESCWALRSGDAEYRPTGRRTVWLPDFVLSDDLWARFAIPISLSVFFDSAPAGRIVALYPSPAGAMESELELQGWQILVAANPILQTLEPDIEGLLVNRLSTPAQYAIAPIDRCYALVGVVKSAWSGISGGDALEHAVADFFDELRQEAAA